MCGPFLPYREELWLKEVNRIALRYKMWDPGSETKFYQTSKPGLFTECDIKMSVNDNTFYQSRTSEKKGILFYLNSALQLRQWRPGGSSCFKLHVGDGSVLLFVASNSYRFLYCGLEKMILNILPSFPMLKQTIPLILGSQGSVCSRLGKCRQVLPCLTFPPLTGSAHRLPRKRCVPGLSHRHRVTSSSPPTSGQI